MEQKSDEKQPAGSPSKQGSKKRESGGGASGRLPAESPSKSESNDEAKEREQGTETANAPSDKRQLETKEQKYVTLSDVGASIVSVALSPTKRRCTERYIVASEKIQLEEKQLKADEPETSAPGVVMQGSPKRSQMTPGTSAAGFVIQGSPKRSPTIPGTSAAGFVNQGSPKRSQMTPGTSAAGGTIQGSPKHLPIEPTTSDAGFVTHGSPKRSPTSPGTSAAGFVIQGSPKRSPTIPGTSAAGGTIQGSPKHLPIEPRTSDAGFVTQGSPKRSPTIPGTSAAGFVIQGSPKRSQMTPGTSAAGGTIQGSPKHLPIEPRTSDAGFVTQGSPKRSPTIPGTSAACFLIQGSPKRSQMTPGTLAAGGIIQGSPKHFPMVPGTSSAGFLKQGSPKRSTLIPGTTAVVEMQGSPKRSPTAPGTSASGFVMQGSPKRSPTKRTYKERHQSVHVDELGEKRLKEESGYQSDSALDLRKDFKKQMPSSTQSSELDCQTTSSDKIRVAEKRPEEKYATSPSSRDPRSSCSEVTSSDGGEADVSSTSRESVTCSSGEMASSTQRCQVQNTAEANKNKTSPRTSPQHSGARAKDAAAGSRSVQYIEVSYPRGSPSKRFYGEPTIRRISPQRASGSGEGCFKVPPPPPPLEERDRPVIVRNALDVMFWLIEDAHAIVSAEQAHEEARKDRELKAKRAKEQAENFAKALLKAAETSKRLQEKEARLKGGIAPDEGVAGPSTSRDGKSGHGSEGKVEESVDKRATLPSKEEPKIAELFVERENSSPAHRSVHDENANVMEAGPSRSACKDDNANKSEPCTVTTIREGLEDDARPSTSYGTAQRTQEAPMSQEHLSLHHLVPQIDEISLDDSLENIAIADSDQEDDDVDLQNT